MWGETSMIIENDTKQMSVCTLSKSKTGFPLKPEKKQMQWFPRTHKPAAKQQGVHGQ